MTLWIPSLAPLLLLVEKDNNDRNIVGGSLFNRSARHHLGNIRRGHSMIEPHGLHVLANLLSIADFPQTVRGADHRRSRRHGRNHVNVGIRNDSSVRRKGPFQRSAHGIFVVAHRHKPSREAAFGGLVQTTGVAFLGPTEAFHLPLWFVVHGFEQHVISDGYKAPGVAAIQKRQSARWLVQGNDIGSRSRFGVTGARVGVEGSFPSIIIGDSTRIVHAAAALTAT
mmetsp:Transcript_31192/g.73209  ORF Transcript_31192/g.73209 Transcript_31192/m.73209 type:complete len:225 (+) Transcript_31192:2-676(+)